MRSIRRAFEAKTYEGDIGTIIRVGDDKIYGFEMIVKDVPGVAAKVTRVFAKYNVNIIKMMVSLRDEEGNVLMYIVGDFSYATIEPAELRARLREADEEHILEVYMAPKVGSTIYSDKIFPFKMGGTRIIAFGPANIKGLMVNLREKLGREVADTLLFYMGEAIGEAVYDVYFKRVKFRSLKELLDMVHGLLVAYGWCRIVEYEAEDNNITLRVSRLWECEFLRNKVEGPAGIYFKGVLKGFFTKYFGREAEVEELECIARGGSHCVFRIRA